MTTDQPLPKVFVLVHVDYDEYECFGIFSSREKAESVLRGKAIGHTNIVIHEYTLDGNLGRELWAVHGIHFHPDREAEPDDGFTRFDYHETPPADLVERRELGDLPAYYYAETTGSIEHGKQLTLSASRQP